MGVEQAYKQLDRTYNQLKIRIEGMDLDNKTKDKALFAIKTNHKTAKYYLDIFKKEGFEIGPNILSKKDFQKVNLYYFKSLTGLKRHYRKLINVPKLLKKGTFNEVYRDLPPDIKFSEEIR